MSCYLKTKDFSVTKEPFELLYDETYDWLVTHPVPKNLDAYYESDDYISHTDGNKGFVERLYQTVKKYNLHKKERLLSSLLRAKGTVLDIGAGTGDFVAQLTNKGWSAMGMEPSGRARARALEKGFQLYGSLEDFEEPSFDCITLWHVLEHVPDLKHQVSTIKKLLKQDGFLIVAVPNYKSYDAKLYGKFWAAFDVPRHLWHFSQTSIKKLFNENDMEVVSAKPMIFDAFYVSILSEKYRTGNPGYLRSFWSGLRSNLSAWGTGEYSSLIYIIQHKKSQN